MSSIGSVGSSSLWYLLYAQSALGPGQVGSSTSTPSTSQSSSTAADSSAAGSSGGVADLRSQIEAAVTNAVSQLGPSASPSDVLQAVGGAVDSTLQANGINPQQSHAHGHHGHHHRAQSSDNQLGSSSLGDSDGDGDGSASGSNDTNGTSGSGGSQTTDLLAILLQIGSQSTQPGSNNTSSNSGNSSNQAGTLASAIDSSTTGGNLDLNTLFGQLFANFPAGSGLNLQA